MGGRSWRTRASEELPTGVALQDRLYHRLQIVSNDTVPDRGPSTPGGRVTTFRPISGGSRVSGVTLARSQCSSHCAPCRPLFRAPPAPRSLLIFEQSVSTHTRCVSAHAGPGSAARLGIHRSILESKIRALRIDKHRVKTP